MIHYYSLVEPTEVTVSLSLVLCVLSHFSHVQLFVTPWTVVHQDPLSMEFSRQEHWSGLPSPSPGDLPDAEIRPPSPALQADSLPSEPPGSLILPMLLPQVAPASLPCCRCPSRKKGAAGLTEKLPPGSSVGCEP